MADDENNGEESKKDLTSLVELSQREMKENPEPINIDGEEAGLTEQPAPEQVSEEDFADLEDVSKKAAAEAPAPLDEAPDQQFETIDAEDFIAQQKAEGKEVPGIDEPEPELNLNSETPTEHTSPAVEFQDEPSVKPLRSETAVEEQQPEPSVAPFETAEEQAPEQDAEIVASDRESAVLTDEPKVTIASTPDPTPEPEAKKDFTDVKEFGEKLAIGQPKMDANPPFSVLAFANFDEKKVARVKDILTEDDYGVRIEDVAIQMSAGKLLIPRISEFAAITMAQKLREICDDIQLGPADSIFENASQEKSSAMLLDKEHLDQHREEVHDLSNLPQTPEDVFASNLSEIDGHIITKVLTVVTSSKVIPSDIAEDQMGIHFEEQTEELTKELVTRAFKMGAHGIIGLNFSLTPIENYSDPLRKGKRNYRLLATGTAVRAKRADDENNVQNVSESNEMVNDLSGEESES